MRIAVLTAAALASASFLSPASAAGTGYFFRAKPMVASATPATPLAATAAAPVSLAPGGTAKPFSVTGGTGPYAWSATGLPTGVTLAADGTLAVADNAAAGVTTGLAATITDATGKTATAVLSLTVTAPIGSLMAFGYNIRGQTLPDSATDQFSPVAVGSGTDWSMVAGNNNGSCAIRGGDLYCWGSNNNGQLGTNGTTDVRYGPQLVSSGGWTDVQGSLNMHACGIRSGKLFCWGSNNAGQIGDGTTTNRTSGPVAADGGSSGWTDVTTGGEHTCGIRGGVAYCWGIDRFGQVGLGSTLNGHRAVSAVGGGSGTTGWTEISASYNSTCGVRNGDLLCWGYNLLGQLGSSGTANRASPTLVAGMSAGWSGLASGMHHVCGLRHGTAYCWGWNETGQVGSNGTANATSGPLAVGGGSGTTGWTMLAAGTYHTCGIRSGELLCWGSNANGRLGVPGVGSGDTPQKVAGTGWKFVAAGYNHTLALK